MNKVTKYVSSGVLLLSLLSCSAFSSSRVEEPSGRQKARVFWVLDGSMSPESAEMFVERYLLPTSVAAMLWTDFTLQGNEVRFDTRGGYRVIRRQRVLAESMGAYAVHGYDLIIDVTGPSELRSARPQSADSYIVRFTYSDSVDTGTGSSGVLPQPLQQALLAGIREDGRVSGKARVEMIEYLGSGRFRATVLVGD